MESSTQANGHSTRQVDPCRNAILTAQKPSLEEPDQGLAEPVTVWLLLSVLTCPGTAS